ncbi:hypothetical protein BKA83DRAFT_274896 [Pisolithus microcarpus]|nr:hypothetical protein BKA83DRAFT_274896 [Pisolithus microcarpus]
MHFQLTKVTSSHSCAKLPSNRNRARDMMAVIKKKGYVVSSIAGTHHMHSARCLELTLVLTGCVYLTKRTADGPSCTALRVNHEGADLALTVKKNEREQPEHADTYVRSTMSSDMLPTDCNGEQEKEEVREQKQEEVGEQKNEETGEREEEEVGKRWKEEVGEQKDEEEVGERKDEEEVGERKDEEEVGEQNREQGIGEQSKEEEVGEQKEEERVSELKNEGEDGERDEEERVGELKNEEEDRERNEEEVGHGDIDTTENSSEAGVYITPQQTR